MRALVIKAMAGSDYDVRVLGEEQTDEAKDSG